MSAEQARELAEAMEVARAQLRATARTLRTTGQILADLAERLEITPTAQPKEAQRHDTNNHPVPH